jgi:hypothetical protein
MKAPAIVPGFSISVAGFTCRIHFVIAGLDPAIHAAVALATLQHGCAAQASEATPFRERLCPRMTSKEFARDSR